MNSPKASIFFLGVKNPDGISQTDQEQLIRSNASTTRPLISVRPVETSPRVNEHKRATKKVHLNNNITDYGYST